MLLPIHIAAGGLAIALGAVALLAKKGGAIHPSTYLNDIRFDLARQLWLRLGGDDPGP